jgi:hypothetical protein
MEREGSPPLASILLFVELQSYMLDYRNSVCDENKNKKQCHAIVHWCMLYINYFFVSYIFEKTNK